MSDGLTPEIRDACPRVAGLTLDSLSTLSLRRPGKFE